MTYFITKFLFKPYPFCYHMIYLNLSVFEDVTDRIRIPWAGGAMKVNNHAVAVTTLFCFFLIVGSINFIGLMLSSRTSYDILKA